jgi:hypothetical protein
MSKTIQLANLSKKAAKSLLTANSSCIKTAGLKQSLNTTSSSNSIVLNMGQSSPASITAAAKQHLAQQQKRSKGYYGTPEEIKSYQENLLLVNEYSDIRWKSYPLNSKQSQIRLFLEFLRTLLICTHIQKIK